MISGKRDRRRWTMFWSAVLSAALHVAVLTFLFSLLVRTLLTPQGARELVSQTTTIAIEKAAHPTPPPPKQHVRSHHVRAAAAPAPAPPRHELAKQSAAAPIQPPQVPHSAATSSLQHDRTTFANEVAALNRQNNPHAVPTIDPSSRASASKSYSFDAHSTSGDQHGNGIITPVRSWHDHGMDCYYARYEYTYPSGAMENGNIPWPACYYPGADPFQEPPHPMPFPLPPAGYALPPGTEMPPLEKSIYERWAASNVPQ